MYSRWHIAQRTEISARRASCYRCIAVVLALVTGAIFLAALGFAPIPVYQTLVSGALGTVSNLRETVKLAIPLVIASLGVTLAFKMRFWNIGAEGQICIGAIAASYFALNCADWPKAVLILVMALAAMLAGGVWGLIPAYFKAKYDTNETLFTLMLNYVAVYIIQLLREGVWRDPRSGFPKVAMFDKASRLPTVLGVHIGWIVALVLVGVIWVYLRRTKQGYELTAVGENIQTARYAGMNVRKIIMRTAFFSAAICALAGMLQATGADKTLAETVAGGRGFTAISIAWLARLNPYGILIVSCLFAILSKGSVTIQSIFNISPSTSDVLQGVILFFVLGCEFFINYRIMRSEGGERRA